MLTTYRFIPYERFKSSEISRKHCMQKCERGENI
jgi:hypothetical protein